MTLALTACGPAGAIGTPGFDFLLGGTIVGTGPRDVWWWAPNGQFGTSGSADDYRDALWHYDGSWTEVAVPAAVATDLATSNAAARVVVAAEDEVWLARIGFDGVTTVVRTDVSGTVLADRSADIAPIGTAAPQLYLHGGSRGVFLGTSTNGTGTWYELEGDAFVPLTAAPGQLQYVAQGADAAYFWVTTNPTGSYGITELYEYRGGTWTLLGDGAISGSFFLPAPDGTIWTAPANPTELIVAHGSGGSWSQIQVNGYDANDTDRSATLWPLAWAVTRDSELAVLSRWSEPAQNGLDWSEQAWVGGTIGLDGAYRQTDVVVPAERCDPLCENGLSFMDGFGPARLDDGSLVLDQRGEGETDRPAANRTLIVWTP